MCWLSDLFKKPSVLELSPSNWLPNEAITWYETTNKIEIDLTMLGVTPKAWIPPIPGTGSMLPNFSHEHNNILISGSNAIDQAEIIDHLQVGDIVVYRIMDKMTDDPWDFTKAHKFYAIHRIVEIGEDHSGKTYRFKGDNNPIGDPYLARQKNILWISIGTIF